MEPHVLDRPVWHALTTCQQPLALGNALARRFPEDVSPFGGAANDTLEKMSALGTLLTPGAIMGLVQDTVPPPPPGVILTQDSVCLQMLWQDFTDTPASVALSPLGDSDAVEMKALADLTQPGPFFARTHTLGGFFGVRDGGRLVAMAGERLHPQGFTEVSGVCTHPDHRGHGLAAMLMRKVGANIVARGEMPFLHVYADNAGAVAVYEKLGFVVRRQMQFCIWTRPQP